MDEASFNKLAVYLGDRLGPKLKASEIALGIVTSVGGFLEIGSIATSSEGGAVFGYRLAWAVVLGGLCSILLIEMSGRFAAVSKHTIAAAMRERFGLAFFALPLVSVVAVSLMVLAAELGGTCVAFELATGVGYQWWALPHGPTGIHAGAFLAIGAFGQFIYVHPAEQVVIAIQSAWPHHQGGDAEVETFALLGAAVRALRSDATS